MSISLRMAIKKQNKTENDDLGRIRRTGTSAHFGGNVK